MTSIYSTGTVSVTNGDAVVTGSGTAWAVALVTGGSFSCAGLSIPIVSVDSDTSLTLAYPWPGATAAGAAYAIQRDNSDAANVVDLYDKMSRVLQQLGLAGIHPDADGTIADRDAITLGTSDKGFIFLYAEPGFDLAFYRWSGTAWQGPFDVQGEKGDAGTPGLGVGGYGLPLGGTKGQFLTKASSVDGAAQWAAGREVLTAARTYYVGYNLGAVAISIANPAVVTKNGHGLVADSRVAFTILPKTKTATISVASPAVVTMANTFAAGQPIVFQSTGALPKGVTAGTTYYVIATGLSGASFQFSATPGGAAINTSAPTVTISQASPGVVTETGHGRAVGDAIRFATTGALPTGLAVGTTYFIKTVLDANTYTVAATPEGAAINTTSAGSGTHTIVQFGTHYLSETGTLPTGVTEGQEYYVLAAGLTANTFQFSATSGGAAIITTGSTAGTIAARTGSDNNDGLTYSQTGAFLTVQKAIDTAVALDLSIYDVVILVDSGVYAGAIPKNTVGSGIVYIRGKNLDLFSTTLTAVAGSTISACFNGFDGFFAKYKCEYLTMSAPAAGAYAIYANSGTVFFGNINFKAVGSVHVGIGAGGFAQATEDYMISGGAPGAHLNATDGGQIRAQSKTITIVGLPTMPFANASRVGTILANGDTFGGISKGARYNVTLNGVVYSGTGSATYFPGSSAGAAGSGGQYT
ncbi:hypothetical protein MPL1032_10276 [Mesorhizobium plurifarium]|uniref:Uncharacterized protein n=1 Tax=Mesorhizobium plurifarium TaxID=69974 RepID=A0A0K2VNI1_MESPL|nr:hypothetical protein MPL1032_10276 [Mesorhizobium plurifarium]